MLNRGGKRINYQNVTNQTAVGAHMVNENSREPLNLEKNTYDRNSVFPTRPSNSAAHSASINLCHQQRSASQFKGRHGAKSTEPTRPSLPADRMINAPNSTGRARMNVGSSLPNRYAAGDQEQRPAAGSANLMSPQQKQEATLGANKRIGADMLSKSISLTLDLTPPPLCRRKQHQVPGRDVGAQTAERLLL